MRPKSHSEILFHTRTQRRNSLVSVSRLFSITYRRYFFRILNSIGRWIENEPESDNMDKSR